MLASDHTILLARTEKGRPMCKRIGKALGALSLLLVAVAGETAKATPPSCAGWGTARFSYDLTLTRYCLGLGMNPNARTGNGETPLMWAAWKGKADTVTWFWSLGVDMNAVNNAGTTVLIWAASQLENSETVKALLLFGANPNVMDTRGVTALTASAAWGDAASVALLLDFEADPNARDPGNMTALMAAAMEGHQRVVRLLLAAGADPHIHGKFGTAAQLAAEQGHTAIAHLLRRYPRR